jgi:hypothetical protein
MAMALVALSPAHAREGEARFRVSAEIRVQHLAGDRRFAIETAMQGEPAQASEDGRFTLKVAGRASCDPNDDLIFRDDFEPASP